MKLLRISFLFMAFFASYYLLHAQEDTPDFIKTVKVSDEWETAEIIAIMASDSFKDKANAILHLVKTKDTLLFSTGARIALLAIGLSLEPQDACKVFSEKMLRLAEGGNAAAANKIGNFYLDGTGIDQDYDEAFRWYAQAAEWGSLFALNGLGYCYENGFGVEKDNYQAFSFYKNAAIRGVSTSFNNVAQCYANGVGTSVNIDKAIAWFEKGAENGFRSSQVNAGVLLYEEKKDYEKAFPYLQKGAEQGSPVALYYLGVSYYYGQGITKDLSKARDSFVKAEEGGIEQAKKWIELIDSEQ